MKKFINDYKKEKKHIKVKDLESAKKYVENALQSWYVWCLHHREMVKALEIILGVENEKENN